MRRAPAQVVRASALLCLLLGGCGSQDPAERLEQHARQYVSLGLALRGVHDKEVDAWFGPAELDTRDKDDKPDLVKLAASVRALQSEVTQDAAAEPVRRERLQRKLAQLAVLLEVLSLPKPLPFDEEGERLFGIAPIASYDYDRAKLLRVQLDELLPGTGALAFRVGQFRNQFVVPADKRQAVLERALAECRTRTLAHWPLLANERLTLAWSRSTEAAWHRYQGKGRSTLTINPLAVALPGAAIEVACHEGYPGHHAQFMLMEMAAGPAGLPVESQLVLLRSRASVLREGAANYGVELAFPPEARATFLRDVLFPMAGLPPDKAERYAMAEALINELSLAVAPILRAYRNGSINFNTATHDLAGEALLASPGALLKYVDDYGAYVLGYTVARDRVRDFVTTQATASAQDPWTVLRTLVAGLDGARGEPGTFSF